MAEKTTKKGGANTRRSNPRAAFHKVAMALLDKLADIESFRMGGRERVALCSTLPPLPPRVLEVIEGFRAAQRAAAVVQSAVRQGLGQPMPNHLTPELRKQYDELLASKTSPEAKSKELGKLQDRADALLRKAKARHDANLNEMHDAQAVINGKESELVAEWFAETLPALAKLRDEFAAALTPCRPDVGRIDGYTRREKKTASACAFLLLAASAVVDREPLVRTVRELDELRIDIEGEIAERVSSKPEATTKRSDVEGERLLDKVDTAIVEAAMLAHPAFVKSGLDLYDQCATTAKKHNIERPKGKADTGAWRSRVARLTPDYLVRNKRHGKMVRWTGKALPGTANKP